MGNGRIPIRPDWYDKFAPMYDVGTMGDWFYRKPREFAIEKLEIPTGNTVVDIFCGTGGDFSRLADQVGNDGAIVAIDGSVGMLGKARMRADIVDDNAYITLLQADFSEGAGIKSVQDAILRIQPRHIFFSLGLTCLSNWKEFSDLVFQASPSGTRFAIMDVYSNKMTWGARFINWIGAADCSRKVWSVLEESCIDYEWREFRPFKLLDVSVIVASGEKP